MNYKDKVNLLNNFPDIELSYEKRLHNKVQNIDCYLTIPYGSKYFAWFYNYKNKNTLILLKINKKNNNIISIEKKIACFKSNLCIGKGTILYGTIFQYNDVQYFNIEDLLYYKNKNTEELNNLDKFHLEYELLKNDIKQVIYKKNNIIFGLPNISTQYNDIYKNINKIPYKIYSIQHRFLTKNINIFYNERVDQIIEKFAIFKVEATIQPDIYHLTCYDKEKCLIKFRTSHISSYKNSVFLNSIFRNIKENINIDYIEESDDEEEFQNIAPDKYVKNIVIKMKCKFLPKFNSWEPISRSNENISTTSYILMQEK